MGSYEKFKEIWSVEYQQRQNIASVAEEHRCRDILKDHQFIH